MADWELTVQGNDGGIMQGTIGTSPRRSIAFNTGMVMHGWLDLLAAESSEGYRHAARRAGEFLIRNQSSDGAWRGDCSYRGIPHAYHARVAWALLRLASATGDRRYHAAALRNLDWVVARQDADGFLPQAIFAPGTLPNTHALAYTMRGLLESAVLTGQTAYLDAALLAARPLAAAFERLGWLPGRFAPAWRPAACWECLTGTAQMGGVWLRLGEITGDGPLRRAGLRAVAAAAAEQQRDTNSALDGALAGSRPIYGRYAPLAFPNWAAKFLVDALAVRARVLAAQPAVRGVVEAPPVAGDAAIPSPGGF
jgi:Squalene-hopene cyclase C-terminal domain